MEAKAAEQATPNPKKHDGQKKHKKGKKESKTNGKGTGKHRKRKGHKSKSKSKGKKVGFLCCRKKAKHSKSKKSKTTKKQPHSKAVKPLPPVPNEQLGEIVLVKNLNQGSKPKTPVPSSTPVIASTSVPKQKKAPDAKTPKPGDVSGSKATASKEKLNLSKEKVNLSKEKVNLSKEGDLADSKESELKIIDIDKEEKPKVEEKKKEAKEPKEPKEDSKKKDENCSEPHAKKEERKEKWVKLVKRFNDEDANLAVNDFEQVCSYIPPHVTKHNFSSNRTKNRFSDVVCLDHSRVHLNDGAYIHANWVDLDTQKKAILTQLPLPHTAADFWQMVIEQRVKCVLLLLTDQEYEKLGGDFVFPQNQDFLNFEERSIRVGEFKLVEISKGWNLKVLSVSNGNYKTFLHVHHYKMWPHDSIPPNVKKVWQIQSALRKYTAPIVHMSLSGCGRAGTFALFENAHASIHSDEPTFEMVKCLENVRNGRMHSVQNIRQFSFVYTLIAEHIIGNGMCKLLKKGGGDEEEEVVDAMLRQLTIT